MDEPRFDDDEIVVRFEYPADYGTCALERRISGETFDAVLNQLMDEGVQP
jgi:hypothetical protein